MTNSDHNQGRHPGQAPGSYQQRPPFNQPNPAAAQAYDPRLGGSTFGTPLPVPGMMPQQPGPAAHGNPPYPPIPGGHGTMPQMPATGAPAGYGQPQQGMVPAMPMTGGDYYYPQGQQPLPEVPAFAMPPGMQPQAAPDYSPQYQAHAGNYDADALAYHAGPTDYAGHGEAGVHAAADYSQAASDHGAVQQISQRLAQLQSQYEQEMAQAGRSAPHQGYHAPESHASPHVDPGQYHQQKGYTPQGYPQQAQMYAPAAHQPAPQGSAEHGGYYDQSAAYAQQGYEQQPAYHAQHGTYASPDHAAAYQQEGHAPYAAGTVIAHHQVAGGGSRRTLAMAGAFIGALVIGGGAAYTYKFTDILGNRSGDVAAPVVKAVTAPVKVINERTAEKRDSEDRALHDRLSGSDVGSGTGDRMAAPPSGEPRKVAAAATGMLPAAEKDGGSDAGLPRRVKTLIVRPDGSIIQPSDKLEAVPESAGKQAGAAEAANELAAATAESTPSAKPAPELPREDKVVIRKPQGAENAAAAGKNPTRQATTQMVQRVKPEAEEKQVKTAAVSAKTAVSAGAGVEPAGDVGEPYVVQVTSRDSPTSALAAFADLQQKYPKLIGSYEPDIERADLGDKGIWYRLRVGPVAGKMAATDLCSKLKSAGHAGCFVRRK